MKTKPKRSNKKKTSKKKVKKQIKKKRVKKRGVRHSVNKIIIADTPVIPQTKKEDILPAPL